MARKMAYIDRLYHVNDRMSEYDESQKLGTFLEDGSVRFQKNTTNLLQLPIWNILPNVKIVGNGLQTRDTCGSVRAYYKTKSGKHLLSHTRCYQAGCPKCFSEWASRQAYKIEAKVFRKALVIRTFSNSKYDRKFYHSTFSVLPEIPPTPENLKFYYDKIEECITRFHAGNYPAYVIVPHPFRLKKECPVCHTNKDKEKNGLQSHDNKWCENRDCKNHKPSQARNLLTGKMLDVSELSWKQLSILKGQGYELIGAQFENLQWVAGLHFHVYSNFYVDHGSQSFTDFKMEQVQYGFHYSNISQDNKMKRKAKKGFIDPIRDRTKVQGLLSYELNHCLWYSDKKHQRCYKYGGYFESKYWVGGKMETKTIDLKDQKGEVFEQYKFELIEDTNEFTRIMPSNEKVVKIDRWNKEYTPHFKQMAYLCFEKMKIDAINTPVWDKSEHETYTQKIKRLKNTKNAMRYVSNFDMSKVLYSDQFGNLDGRLYLYESEYC